MFKIHRLYIQILHTVSHSPHAHSEHCDCRSIRLVPLIDIVAAMLLATVLYDTLRAALCAGDPPPPTPKQRFNMASPAHSARLL